MTSRPDRIFLAESYFCLQLPCLRIVFPAVGHGVEVGRGPIIILVFNAAKHTVVPKSLTGRVILDATVIIGNGFLVFLLPDAAKTTQFVLTGNIRIEADGFGTIVLRSNPVVEIELGYSAEEPWFIKIGFGRDDLIEILD